MTEFFRLVSAAVISFFLFVCFAPNPGYADDETVAPVVTDYLLNPGDKVEISVWREDDLARSLVVLPDGSITFPLAGRIKVAGLTTTEAEQLVSKKLAKFLADPVVTIIVEEVAGNRVFVLGKVRQPGPFVMEGRANIAQILALAGGLDRFADSDDIIILRGQGEDAVYFPFDYDDLLSGDDGTAATFMLQAGDVIIVP